MAKDKKAKKKKDGTVKSKTQRKTNSASSFKTVVSNPMVQEVVAAALVATAAALKDTKKARAMAADAGDQLQLMAEDGSEKGAALWGLALDIAKRAGTILTDGKAAKGK
ncbi:MAG: hypothetical protein ABIR63_01120 [Sphingomicrobium sp.]